MDETVAARTQSSRLVVGDPAGDLLVLAED
jgi:hypothetical protein